MKRIYSFVTLIIVLVGCSPKDREDIASNGRVAFDHALAAGSTAVSSALTEAGKLGLDSDAVSLENAKAKATQALKAIEGVKLDFGPLKEKVASLKLEIDRLDKAIAEQKLREKWDAALVQANNGKKLAEDQIESARKTLIAADAEFKHLDQQLQTAKKAYEDASDRVKGVVSTTKP